MDSSTLRNVPLDGTAGLREPTATVTQAPTPLAPAHTADNRADLLAQLGSRRTPLTLRDIRDMTHRLQAMSEPLPQLRMAVLHTYTTELLQPYWRFECLLQGFELEHYGAPYGALMQEGEPASGLAAANPDFVYLFMRWEDLEPRLTAPVSGLAEGERDSVVKGAAATVSTLIQRLRQVCAATFVVTLLPKMWGPEHGVYDAMTEQSDTELRRRIKRAIARSMEAIPSALFSDLDEVALDLGRLHMFDMRLWETSRFPFSVAGAQFVVRYLLSYAVAQLQPKAKCIVLDADNTLWGGVVGEDGVTGIALGPDFPGSAYVSFQRRLLELQQRGFLLALCSKNNPQDVAEVLAHHPHQVLKQEHFAAMYVNWDPKPDNLRALAIELNLGLESFIFVDDSAHECLAVRQQLPQVTVAQTPGDLLELPFFLDGVARLQITSLTNEDRSRTAMYAHERTRQTAAASFSNLEDYLASLEMVMRVGFDDERHVARIAQLTQKTNQFNLTTHRYSEAQIISFMRNPDWMVVHFTLADIFGDSGLVGVALLRGVASNVAEVDTLLMSCRVIGRRAEHAFVRHILQRLAEAGIERVMARYSPTAKNDMVREFWPTVGFTLVEAETEPEEALYAIDLRAGVPVNEPILPMRVLTDTTR